jgi:glycerophosphoryl diester phosphodiesterase
MRRRPRVIAHRGASGYAYQNSSAALRLAVDLGADGVELDIHATIDGILLIHHDPEVDGLGRISELPASAFTGHRLPNGEAIPTLAEGLELLAGLEVWVEVKSLPSSRDDVLLAALDAAPTPGRCAVHGFDHRIIARLGDRRPSIRRGVLLASYLLDNAAAVLSAGADTLWMETELIDAGLVEELHSDGLELIAWTTNEDHEVRRLAQLGVDAICGNFPDRIRAALA